MFTRTFVLGGFIRLFDALSSTPTSRSPFTAGPAPSYLAALTNAATRKPVNRLPPLGRHGRDKPSTFEDEPISRKLQTTLRRTNRCLSGYDRKRFRQGSTTSDTRPFGSLRPFRSALQIGSFTGPRTVVNTSNRRQFYG